MQEPPMKSPDEIQKAHDLMAAFILGEVPMLIDDKTKFGLTAALDTLCWVLGHTHNTAFANNLKKLQAIADANGYVLVKGKRPHDTILH
jgi:hypothetical protein